MLLFLNLQKQVLNALLEQKKYRDSLIILNYDVDDWSQGYGQIKEAFRALTTDGIPNPYISEDDFKSTNVNAAGEATNDIGYNLYVFDVRHQKVLESAQIIKVELKFSESVPAGKYGYALVLTNKLVNISSGGQRHFDLISV